MLTFGVSFLVSTALWVENPTLEMVIPTRISMLANKSFYPASRLMSAIVSEVRRLRMEHTKVAQNDISIPKYPLNSCLQPSTSCAVFRSSLASAHGVFCCSSPYYAAMFATLPGSYS